MDDPLKTISCGGIHAALVAPFLTTYHTERRAGEVRGSQLCLPLPTLDTSNRYGVVVPFLERNFGGPNGYQAPAVGIGQPLPTITANGHTSLVAAFLTEYYSQGSVDQSLAAPMRTVTTKDRHSLVLVEIDGATYAITDIGMRMLEPHELARAMGFPDDYQWTKPDGSLLTKRDRVKMIGNACPVNTVAELIKTVVLARGQAFGMRGAA